MCVNNLPKVVTASGPAMTHTRDLLDRESTALVITPLGL